MDGKAAGGGGETITPTPGVVACYLKIAISFAGLNHSWIRPWEASFLGGHCVAIPSTCLVYRGNRVSTVGAV